MSKGFIFTMDAVLTLLPIFIILASVSGIGGIDTIGSYRMLSSGRYAQDVLTVMERNDTLVNIGRNYQTGVARGDSALIAYSQNLLNSSLNKTIPPYMGYNATVTTPRGTFSVASGGEPSGNIMSVWRTSMGPELGWAGSAWLAVRGANFTIINRTTTSTIWNFHNWLSVYYSFCADGWGGPSGSTNITISTPSNATLNDAYYYLGAKVASGNPYNVTFYLNGGNATSSNYPDDYTYLLTYGGDDFYNSKMDLPFGTTNSSGVLGRGNNKMWLNFTADCSGNDEMPWFAIIANYTQTIPSPQSLEIEIFNLPNAEGATDESTTVTWDDNDATWASRVDAYSDGTPYKLLTSESFDAEGNAITVFKNFSIPAGVTVLDGTIDLNLVGAVDATRVEVFDSSASQWVTVFNSFDINGIDYTDVDYDVGFDNLKGYGNLPGKLNIDPSLLSPGSDSNSVRVTLWDYYPDPDYAGIIDSTILITYSPFSIDWDNFAFNSHQSSSFDYTQDRDFDINTGAKEALLFVGVGIDTRKVVVSIMNATSSPVTLYNSTVIPYMLNLAELDAGLPASQRILTTDTSTPSDYILEEGSYTTRVRVLSAQDAAENNAWESGDRDDAGGALSTQESNAEIFSGTKVTVLYPEFIAMLTTESYNATAAEAEDEARNLLSEQLLTYNLTMAANSSEIFSKVNWVSGEPSIAFVELKIWYEG